MKKKSVCPFILTGSLVLAMSSTQTSAIDLKDGVYAEIFTKKGTIVCQLEYKKTPITVSSFVGLAEGTIKTNRDAGIKFYDGLKFHRVVPGFVIQGGDPNGNGTGGPGYRFPDEFDPSLRHTGAGILSMANSGPATNGSQFFITLAPTPHLDDKHSVFGHVVSGMELLDKIEGNDVIDSMRIKRVGAAAEKFTVNQESFEGLMKKISEKDSKTTSKKAADLAKVIKKKYPDAVTLPSGLMYVMVKEGTGSTPKQGADVKVHYTGTLLDGGKEFDSSKGADPIDFQVGVGMVIPGWDEGIMLMKKGEKRVLIIPADLAYGDRGYPPVIPGKATLVFDVELVSF